MNRLIVILGGCLCILLLSSSMKREKKYSIITTTPEKLQLFVNQHNDPYTIKVAYTLNVPAYYIPSCARMVYQPYFLAVGHRYDLTPLIISGRENSRQERRLQELAGKQPQYPDAMHLISEGDGMRIKLLETVPFEVWMAQSKLRADVTLEYCDREKHLEVLTLADGVIWFPLAPGPALVKYVKEMADVPKESRYWFIYPVGAFIFDREFDGNAGRMQNMMRLIDSLQTDTTMHLKKIVITGSSSPSGSETTNKRLAQQRAQQMKQRLIERRHISGGLIEVDYVPVDWQGFRELLGQSDIPDKERINRILEGDYSDDQKIILLRKLPQYKYLQQHIFPKLQRVTCTFNYIKKEEITKIVPE